MEVANCICTQIKLYNYIQTYFCVVGSDLIYGDTLSLASGLLTVFATFSKTLLIKERLGIFEFMSLLGFSGAIISAIQLLVVKQTYFTIL